MEFNLKRQSDVLCHALSDIENIKALIQFLSMRSEQMREYQRQSEQDEGSEERRMEDCSWALKQLKE